MGYCRNCGEPFSSDDSVLCMRCGYQRGKGSNYCPACGKMVAEDASFCVYCGTGLNLSGTNAVKSSTGTENKRGKSRALAGVLGIFFGCFGVHNFYLGYTTKAMIQLVVSIVSILLCCVFIGLFPLLGMIIWSFVESIMILTGNINKDAMGNPLVD